MALSSWLVSSVLCGQKSNDLRWTGGAAGAAADCDRAVAASLRCAGTNGDVVGHRKLGSCGFLWQGVELSQVGVSPRLMPIEIPLTRQADLSLGPHLASQWDDTVVSVLGEKSNMPGGSGTLFAQAMWQWRPCTPQRRAGVAGWLPLGVAGGNPTGAQVGWCDGSYVGGQRGVLPF